MENNNFEPVNENAVNETPVAETPAAEAPVAEAPAAAPVATSTAGLGKIGAMLKGDPKKLIIAAVAAILAIVIVVVGVFAIVNAVNNTYKRPFKIQEEYLNKKSYYDSYESLIDLSNGFCKKELKTIYKLIKSTEDYKDELEDNKEDFEDYIDDKKDEYGSNYKYKIKVDDRDEIDKDDLKEVRDSLRDAADRIEEAVEETEDYDSDDWEELADDLGFEGNKSKAKKYVKAVEAIGKKLKKAKVSKGYEVEYIRTLKGKEIDDPDDYEYEGTMNVYKVAGKWIDASTLTSLMYIGASFS